MTGKPDTSLTGSRTTAAVIGHNVPRVDALEKVTGHARYIADVALPGMLEGAILRSPYPHASIVRMDTTKAARLRGVQVVLTGENTPKRKWGALQQDQYPLAVDKVRYVGDEVAAVAAVDKETAEEALSLIEVEYDKLPAVFDAIGAMEPDAPLVHEQKERNISLHFTVERGDPDGAMAGADLVLEDWFETQLQWHAAIETIGTVAQCDPRGKLTLWMNTSRIFPSRTRIAQVLGMSTSDVRVIQNAVGGAFGGKGCSDNNAIICALLATKASRPVRLINSRQDEFLATRPRPAMKIWIRLGFRRDGTIVAKDVRMIVDNGAYTILAPAVGSMAALGQDALYRYRDLRSELFVVHTNRIPTGAFRGFGSPEAAFALGQMVAMGAEALGLDPRDVALKNMIDPNSTSQHGARINSCEVKECVRQATARIGWSEKRAKRLPDRGLGLAAAVHHSGHRLPGELDGASVVVRIDLDGKVQIWSGEGETGAGASTVFAQIAAEELGVRYVDVSVSQADTDTTTYARGSYASRLTYIAGNAIRDACRQIRQNVLGVAAELLEASMDDLEISESVISVKGVSIEARSVTVAEVAGSRIFRSGGAPIAALGTWDPPSEVLDEHHYGNEAGASSFAAHAVEVEVDRETGQFRILDYVAVTDAGTIVYPIGAEGQIDGAIAQGLGYAATEGLMMEEGRPANPNFSDYRIPCVLDMPPLQRAFVRSYEPTGPAGAKGIGEIGLDPVPAALANAIYDAVGVRIKTLPITAEKIRVALRDKIRAEERPAAGKALP